MIKFYGYKRCSTSKKAQKWLDDHHIAYEYQDLVEKPPKQEDLLKWLNKFQDRGLRYFFNTSGCLVYLYDWSNNNDGNRNNQNISNEIRGLND